VPRYFFTIRGQDRIKDDHDGTNLPNVAAALSTAESKIREVRKEPGARCCPCRFFRATNSHRRNAAFCPQGATARGEQRRPRLRAIS
jgi:hypothetical protein